jgi:hypothetical protein
MVNIFQHSAFADDVSHAFGSYDFIFTDIFEGKGQVRILPLNNSHLSKGTSADDSQQAEMIQVHFAVQVDGLSLAIAHREGIDMLDNVELS